MTSHLAGVVPVSATKRRANVRSDIRARRARSGMVCSVLRLSSIQVSSGAKLSAVHSGIGSSMYWR
jgi:hypothetical protein